MIFNFIHNSSPHCHPVCLVSICMRCCFLVYTRNLVPGVGILLLLKAFVYILMLAAILHLCPKYCTVQFFKVFLFFSATNLIVFNALQYILRNMFVRAPNIFWFISLLQQRCYYSVFPSFWYFSTNFHKEVWLFFHSCCSFLYEDTSFK